MWLFGGSHIIYELHKKFLSFKYLIYTIFGCMSSAFWSYMVKGFIPFKLIHDLIMLSTAVYNSVKRFNIIARNSDRFPRLCKSFISLRIFIVWTKARQYGYNYNGRTCPCSQSQAASTSPSFDPVEITRGFNQEWQYCVSPYRSPTLYWLFLPLLLPPAAVIRAVASGYWCCCY